MSNRFRLRRTARISPAISAPAASHAALRDAIEPLEARLLMAFVANVNFQPAGAPVPANYVTDTGAPFGRRLRDISFGWNSNNSKNAFDRNAANSADQRYDTGNLLQGKGRRWEIAVPNGVYSVHIAAGDPTSTSARYRINAEGTSVVNGNASRRHRWFEGRKNITVTDGRLTLTGGSGTQNNRINFIELKLVSPEVRVRATDASASEAGNDPGAFTLTRTGKTGKALTVRYRLTGTASNGNDYNTLSGTVVIPKGSSSTTVQVSPKDDSANEGAETVTLELLRDNHYNLRKGKKATVTIADNDQPSQSAPTVTVVASDNSASEQAKATGRFTITRTGGTGKPLTVHLTLSGSATNGTDYNTINAVATIPAGQSSVVVVVTPKDDAATEKSETVVLTLAANKNYKVGSPASATVSIADNDVAPSKPAAPTITEPSQTNQVLNGGDVHMEINPATEGDMTDWEIWTTGSNPQVVWFSRNVTDEELDNHIHFGDGTFTGPQAGREKLQELTSYELRVRIRRNGQWSDFAKRVFRTRKEDISTAAGWVAQQPGYVIEEIPFAFAEGAQGWRLPTNIAFVPQGIRGNDPKDPLFYVTELYGSIRVVTNDFTVYTYANGVLNYNPNGPFGGSGENGLTGIAVDPANGDVFVTMLYDDPTDGTGNTFPKVTRFDSNDGGLHAIDTNTSAAGTQGTDILVIKNTADSVESQRQSHIISNISFGPDGKLYVHNGEGFQATRAANLDSFGGKILRMNKDGSAPTDNPFYEAGDRHNDGKPDARDYVWGYGFRNPFGGAWREASGSRAAQLWVVENGPALDRLSQAKRGQNQGWTGSDPSMRNFNIAYAPGGNFSDGSPDWDPPTAPVQMAWVQNANFGGSNFPGSKFGHAFVTLSGETYGDGPNYAKSIEEWIIDDAGNRVGNDELVSYEGPGHETAGGIAAGPDGLYFTTIYPDDRAAGATGLGARILRVVYTGASAAASSAAAAPSSASSSSADDLAVVESATFPALAGSGPLFSTQPVSTWTDDGSDLLTA